MTNFGRRASGPFPNILGRQSLRRLIRKTISGQGEVQDPTGCGVVDGREREYEATGARPQSG